MVDRSSNHKIHLCVSDQFPRNVHEDAFASVRPGTYFHETRSAGGVVHHFSVTAPVTDAQRVQHLLIVLEYLLGDIALSVDDDHAVIDEISAVGRSFDILPASRELVNAVDGDSVHDILVALEVFLQQHACVGDAKLVLLGCWSDACGKEEIK